VSTTGRRRSPTRLFLIFLAAALALHLPGLVVKLFNSDEASAATMAMVIDHGGRLYHQTADRKPPGLPYVYAAVFKLTGTHDVRPVRAAGIVVLALTALLLAIEARRRYGDERSALWCGLLFLVAFAAFFPDDSQAASFELFMLLPLTAAVLAAGRRRPIAAGVLLALACLTKQTAAVTALPIIYLLFRDGGWRPVVRAAVSGTAVVLVTALAFGPGPFLLWTVTGNGGYLALHGSLGEVVLRGIGMTAALLGINIGLVVLCGMAARRYRIEPDLWLWLASAAIAVLAGLRFFGHYYLQLLPPLVLIAVAGLPAFTALARRRLATVAVLPAGVMFGLAFIPLGDAASLPYEAVATHVAKVTDKTDTVFVWGDLPEVYLLSGRQPGTRMVHTGFVTGNTGGRDNGIGESGDGVPGAMTMLREDMAAHPPDLIVDTSTAQIRQSEFYPLRDTPLWSFVERDYRFVGTVAGVNLYRYVNA
jgi:dolichyl-phosphate-mannose-protein mannosyltransferase